MTFTCPDDMQILYLSGSISNDAIDNMEKNSNKSNLRLLHIFLQSKVN